MDKYKVCSKIIKRNIELDLLYEKHPYSKDMIDGIYELIVEMMLCKNESIVISSNEYPVSLVKKKFMKLNITHIEYVLQCLENNESKIRNMKKYILAALFNAPSTIDGYYQMRVKQMDKERL